MIVTCCSDLHRGPVFSKANDATTGWAEAWAKVTGHKFRLGDMDELWQFTEKEIGELAGTDLDGNHDEGSCDWTEVTLGDTVFVHGHIFDPRWMRWVGRPITWAVGKLERIWPDADVKLEAFFQKRYKSGRHGESQKYVRKAAAYARKRGARQIVFGHLHETINQWVGDVHVVCVGCCCNGRLDFVEVDV